MRPPGRFFNVLYSTFHAAKGENVGMKSIIRLEQDWKKSGIYFILYY